MCVVVCVVCNKDYVRVVEEEERKKRNRQGNDVEKEKDVHGKVNNAVLKLMATPGTWMVQHQFSLKGLVLRNCRGCR